MPALSQFKKSLSSRKYAFEKMPGKKSLTVATKNSVTKAIVTNEELLV